MLPALRISALTASLLLTLTSFSQLNGTYTIDQSGVGDYLDISSAVNDLTTLGVSGPVLFEILPGTYVGQHSITNVPGASATDTIGFRGQSLDSSDVIIDFPATGVGSNDYCIELNGVDYVTFEYLTISRSGSGSNGDAVRIAATSSDWNFFHCQIISGYSTSAGQMTMIYSGTSSANIGNSSVVGCRLLNGQLSFTSASLGFLNLFGNTIISHVETNINIAALNCSILIKKNFIQRDGQQGYNLNIGSSNPTSLHIDRNTFHSTGYNTMAIRLSGISGTSVAPLLITGNMMYSHATSGSGRGIWTVGTVNHVHILNNSISITQGFSSSYGIYAQSGAGNLTIHNNAISCTGGGANNPLFLPSGSLVSSNHNVLHSISNSGVRYGTITYGTIAALVSGTGTNQNSVLADPLFVDDENDLHLLAGSPCLNSGSAFGSIVEDIDGDSRPLPIATNPDIGADESAITCFTMSGNYTAGPSAGADFPTPLDALQFMKSCGISGPVVVAIEDGTYGGQLEFDLVPGSSSANTITFRGQSQDSTAVILETPAGSGSNYPVYLNGGDYITIEHLTVRRSGSSTYQNLVYFGNTNPSTDVTLRHLLLIGAPSNSSSNPASVYSDNLLSETGILIEACKFQGNALGVDWDESSSQDELTIRNCVFENQRDAIYAESISNGNLLVEGNIITNPSYTGIYLYNCSGSYEIKRNQISGSPSYAAMYLRNSSASTSLRSTVSNNSIIQNGTQNAIFLSGSNYMNFQHNSVSSTSGNALRYYSSNVALDNNALYSQTGYAFYRGGNYSVTSADNNMLYSGGTNVAYSGGNRPDINALSAIVAQFGSSFEADPMFVDPLADLHLQTGSPCLGIGSNSLGYTLDVDGESRPRPIGTNPDIGADENNDGCDLLSGTYVIGTSVAADFASFSEVADKLNTCGIAAPVVFEVEDGTYTDKFVLKPINGSSAANTITFRGQSLDSAAVTIFQPSQGSVSNNYALRFDGADYVTFEHIGFERTIINFSLRNCRIVEFHTTDASEHINFNHCRFNGDYYSASNAIYAQLVYSNNAVNESKVEFSECAFIDGGQAIEWISQSEVEEVSISKCTFENGYRVVTFNGMGGKASFTDNEIKNVLVQNAAVDLIAANGGFEIERNEINLNSGLLGIEIFNSQPTNAEPGLVRNNFIHSTSTNSFTAAIRIWGNNTNLRVVNNSISLSRGRGIEDSSTGSNHWLVNNAIRVSGSSSYPIYKTGSAAYSSCSNNVLFNAYTIGNPVLARWGGNQYNMATLQAVSGLFANSIDADPNFVDPALDLHIQSPSPCAGTGIAVTGLVVDIDGESRPNPVATAVDIGADESPDYCQDMNGTYVIGTSMVADYTDFASAIGQMLRCGISGPVVFQVEDGQYLEKIYLPEIPGNSSINTITFIGNTSDSSLVSIRQAAQNSSTDNYVLRFDGADYVSFEYIEFVRYNASFSNRYCRVIDFHTTNASEHVALNHCRFEGDYYTTSYLSNYAEILSSMNLLDEVSVTLNKCAFADGGWAVRWAGNSNTEQLTFDGCTFNGCYVNLDISMMNEKFTFINNEIIQTNTSNAAGLMLVAVNGGFEVANNKIGFSRNGLRVVNCDNTGLAPGVIRNNMLDSYSTGFTYYGVEISGSSNNISLLNNSISMRAGRGVYFNLNSIGGQGLSFVNNAVRMNYSSSAYTVYLQVPSSVSFSECAHNVLFNAYNSNSARLAFWGGLFYDLAALQAASGLFVNSYQADPLFVNNFDDLHLQTGSPCAGVGKALTAVIDDFDGESRPNPVASNMDIGADETSEYCQDLNGTYVIGSSGVADFATFTDAIAQMERCGISGSVVFNIENGVYTEKIVLNPILGNSATNTITFQGISGDSTDVVLRSASQYNSPNDNYVVLLNGADYVTFRSMQIERYGGASSLFYTGVIRYGDLDPSVSSFFENCRILNTGGTVPVRHDLVLGSNNVNEESYQFSNTAFVYGCNAISLNGNGLNEALLVESCTFDSQWRIALDLRELSGGGAINGNTISNLSDPASYPIELRQNSSTWIISNNRVEGFATCLHMLDQQGTTANPTRVFNNEFISEIATAISGVIFIENGQQISLDNNTCFSSFSSVPFEASNTTGLTLRNNIFATQTGVYAVSIDATTSINVSDHNLFYRSAGTESVYWLGNSYGSVAALNGATGMDANSYFAFAGFYDMAAKDLRSYSMHANNAATPLPYVLNDISGIARDPANPDIGAHEFTPELWQEQLDVCYSFDSFTSTGEGLNQYIYADRKVIASINDNGNVLGTVTGSVYLNGTGIRQNAQGLYYMDRNWQIEPSNAVSGANVDVRLYYSASEFAALALADPSVGNTGDAGISQYDGPNENCSITDNTTIGNYFTHFPVPAGTEAALAPLTQAGYFDLSIINFSEFYVTGQGNPLPVELLSMDAQRIDENDVALTWTTATETDNQGFEIYRRTEDELEFEFIAWVQGAGNSLTTTNYAYTDYNPTSKISYYYLKQIDFNGASEALPLVAVVGMEQSNTWTVYPNPSKGQFKLQGDLESILSISVVDAAGRVARQFTSSLENYDISRLGAGYYTVLITSRSGKIHSLRLMVNQ